MSYAVSYEREGFVLVSVMSPCTREDHYAALDQAISLCEQNDCSRLLVDLSKFSIETFSAIRCFNNRLIN